MSCPACWYRIDIGIPLYLQLKYRYNIGSEKILSRHPKWRRCDLKVWLCSFLCFLCYNCISAALHWKVEWDFLLFGLHCWRWEDLHHWLLDIFSENKPKNGGICVANHTSPIDVIILASDGCYAMVFTQPLPSKDETRHSVHWVAVSEQNV